LTLKSIACRSLGIIRNHARRFTRAGVSLCGAAMQVTVTHNIADVARALSRLAKDHVPYATARALNDTAADGLVALQDEMKAQFDRPTRWTLNAFMVWRADKRTLRAEVKERPSVGKRHYLKVQGTGGVRPSTGIENALRSRAGYAGHIGSVAPARGARLDASGNWSNGERNQALSGIRAQRDATANTTARSKALAKNRGRGDYFVPKPGSGLSPGIYRRQGKVLTKVLNFSEAGASYGKRIDWRETVAGRTAQVYRGHFERRLAEAIRTAR
jgi:hypothetical protein